MEVNFGSNPLFTHFIAIVLQGIHLMKFSCTRLEFHVLGMYAWVPTFVKSHLTCPSWHFKHYENFLYCYLTLFLSQGKTVLMISSCLTRLFQGTLCQTDVPSELKVNNERGIMKRARSIFRKVKLLFFMIQLFALTNELVYSF